MPENLSRRVGVDEMAGDDRRSVEHLLGQPLQEDQQVYILAFKPGVVPAEAARQRALARMQQTFAGTEQQARQRGVTETEIDETVDEATEHVRYGES
jgi:hypothetical protein